ncbi:MULTISPECIES: hypothetical protein [unclassified Mesorhizobium]|uniref:hypothetical protein n=1 Tax=unclassified Mesorhizobium TaxID=325217 RepID=UPI001093FBF3|nr:MULTISPECIES: hypothetical protein [unclassified Mesorhizobium]TGT45841.1 hypothetical protein EN808_00510 [Mesorhizobium sp. M8A.F.Ca.ET.165.01.1.1]TGT88619.1 hypothetical protein EN804_15950 [Mesorhizobium sp. M8A.F.Ca.ET.161.01.1.1]TGV41919.1 hypothetical protein EN785_15935 [Mesorhizobium sp. M8A.F.Ca.ET.142.01.1.1]
MAGSLVNHIRTAALLLFAAEFWKRLATGLKVLFATIRMLLCRLAKGQRLPSPAQNDCCIQLPPDIYKRADPLLYAQYYLMAQGLAVTWDNPDIDIFDGAAPVTGALQPAHIYRVRVRVWNGSYDAPAIGVGVALSYLSFGAQTVSRPIANTAVNLGAKGTIDCPAYAEFSWTTPATSGHYCLQAQLSWGDDANPSNNLGQKNVNIAEMRSPAKFVFSVRNEASVVRRFQIEADCYGLPKLRPCAPSRGEGRDGTTDTPQPRLGESKARWARALEEQAYGRFPIPDDWSVRIVPRTLSLQPRQITEIAVEIEAKDAAFRGSKTFNVHVFAIGESGSRTMTGGVTLTATKG